MRHLSLLLLLGLFTAGCVDSQIKTNKETCDNSVDDDSDGKADCADPDCFAFAACCVDRCDEGASLCSNAGVMSCTRGSNGCRALSAPVACTGGTVCSGGSCVLTCSDRCNAGAKQCIAAGAAAECQKLATGCYDWVVGETCGNDSICSGGSCNATTSCTSQCSAGAGKCTANGEVQTCVSLGNGCTDWAFPSSCSAGFTCSQGACVATVVPDSGVPDSGVPDAGACTDDCTSGAVTCDGSSGTRTCGNFDADACLEWSTATACPSGEQCTNNVCTPSTTCSNDCAPMGAAQCDLSGGTRTCGNFDADACLEWSTVTACARTQACSGGACVAVCTDECATGMSTCDSVSAVKTCGNFDADPCYEYSAPTACLASQNCSNGSCGACANECPAMGDRACSGTTGFLTCGNYDADSCLEWSAAPTACMAGETCTGTSCSLPCTDECASNGATRCMGSQVQTCGNSDADSCLEWSAAMACAGGGSCNANVCQVANAPDVRLITPQGTVQSTQGQVHSLLADATPAAGRTLARVEFFANGTKVGETTTSPHQFAYTVPVSATTGSAISVQAQGVDNMGARGYSQFATLNVLNDVPVAAFTATVVNSNVVQVDASASSDTETALAQLQVCWDWDNNGTCDTAYSTTKLETHSFAAAGTYTIGMKVRDAAGQITSTTRQVSFADVQYLGGATLVTTTWYGTIIVTGDLTLPAGQTLTIASGTQVLFVRQDQDMNGVGDHTLTINGTLLVNGTMAAPVLFSGQGSTGKAAGAWDRVVLSGAGSIIDWATIEYADVGLDVRANAVVRNTTIRSTRGDCLVLNNADTSSYTDVTTTLCGGDGVDVSNGSTGVTFTRHASTLNTVRGFSVSGSSALTLDACTLDGNTSDGAYVQASAFNLSNSTVSSNTGTGLTFVQGSTGTITRNQVRTNGREGLRFEDDASASPSLTVNLNNVHSNSTVGATVSSVVSTSLSANVTCCSSAPASSSTYTAPAGKTIRRVRVTYTEGSADSSGYIRGELRSGSGVVLQTWTSSASNVWFYPPANTTSVYLFLVDEGANYAADSISMSQVEVVGPSSADVVTATVAGSIDLQNNYLGTFPNVLSRVALSRPASANLQGFVGVLFDNTWNRGPYKSGAVSSETWSGTIYVTGNITIAAAQVVTVNAGTQVRFVKHDQDLNGDGDFTVTANGKLNVNGSAATPVAFGALAPATGNAFQRIVLAGSTTTNQSQWQDATVANGRVGVELRGDSSLARVNVTGGTSDGVLLTAANNASLIDVVVSGAGARGIALENADGVTLTRPDVRNSGGAGLHINNGSTGVTVSRAFLSTNGTGLSVEAGSTPTVEDSTIRDNLSDGVWVLDASPTIRYCLVTYNQGSGFDVRGTGAMSATFNVVKFNGDAGLSVWSTTSGSSTPTFQSSNVFANGVMGAWRSTIVNANLAATVTCCSSAPATTATWTAPAGKTIRRARVTYTEGSADSSGYIRGELQTGSGTVLQTWTSSTSAVWFYPPPNTTSLRAFLVDEGANYAADSISVSQIEYEGHEAGTLEAMVATDTGTTDARFNYWTATITDVPMKVHEARVGAVNYSGYTGAEYPSGTVMQVGPRP